MASYFILHLSKISSRNINIKHSAFTLKVKVFQISSEDSVLLPCKNLERGIPHKRSSFIGNKTRNGNDRKGCLTYTSDLVWDNLLIAIFSINFFKLYSTPRTHTKAFRILIQIGKRLSDPKLPQRKEHRL